MRNFVLVLIFIFVTSCASVGAVIEGGKDLGSSIVDGTVSTIGSVAAAALDDVSSVVGTVADATGDVVDVVVENVDEQTDELQKSEEKQEKYYDVVEYIYVDNRYYRNSFISGCRNPYS